MSESDRLYMMGKMRNKTLGRVKLTHHSRGERRAFHAAIRNGCGCEDRYRIDLNKLREFIESGNAFDAREVGEKTIRLWCEWVTGEKELPII